MNLSGKLLGIEIIGTAGDDVVSVNTGNVVWVAPYRGYGRLVMVEGADNIIYAYGGNEETFVHVGDRVSPGTLLGKVGVHPIEKRAKVFFFVYKDGKPLDPLKAPRG
jgi:septal ring factor EnvC (AmiA/AmiB activator)